MAEDKEVIALLRKHKHYHSDTRSYNPFDVYTYASKGDIRALREALNHGDNSKIWYCDPGKYGSITYSFSERLF